MIDQDISFIKSVYEPYRNIEAGKKMSAYMKHKFPFIGISSPQRTEINKAIFNNLNLKDIAEVEQIARKLWTLNEREYQYLAINLIEKAKNKLTPSHIEFIIELIESKSWWDSVDALAPHFVGFILLNYPELREEYIPEWVKSDNFWLNRTAILFQLKYKEETDFELLKSIIEPLKTKKEFFIRKAIGWALREYSKTSPDEVENYIKKATLQPLSEKEGLKHILKLNNI